MGVGVGGLLALFLMFFYCFFQTEELERKIAGLEASLEESETQRISDAYEFQRKLEQLSGGVPEPEKTPSPDFASALRNGEIQSVLVIGDSISDGNGDAKYIYSPQERAENGYRLIMETEDGKSFYETAPDGQGWVKFFRDYLLENTSVTEFYNNAIDGKSAKWGSAHKEQWIPRDYDAIFVMLGTNDRRDCRNESEFYTEYAQFLDYAARHCTYLTVLVPPPAVPTLDPLNMDSRQIADTVVTLCENNGYSYINLYLGLLHYTASLNLSLDDILHDGTHPSPSGYLRLWRLIAAELKLNVELNDFYDADLTASGIPETVVQIGVNRSDITEQTNLYAQDQAGHPIFAAGDSIYLTTNPFGETAPYGGTLITHRSPGQAGGYQILKPVYGSSNYIRYANEDGSWIEWRIFS